MTWLLVVTIVWPGHEPEVRALGLMATVDICQLAGAAIAELLIATDPLLAIGVSCVPQVET